MTTLTGFTLLRHFNDNITQVDLTSELGRQPANLHPQAQNILIIGSNSWPNGTGTGPDRQGYLLDAKQSGTLIILHIAADRKSAAVMSIPPNSYVSVPSCEMSNGRLSAPTQTTINEAFSTGNLHGNNKALGAACTVKTVEQDTGIYINHFVVMDFGGFKDMVAALGGVPVTLPTAFDAPYFGVHLSAGTHVLTPVQALAYVRYLSNAIDGVRDVSRLDRQAAFMSALTSRAKSELLNPVAVYKFLNAVTRSLTIDRGLGGITGLFHLEQTVQDIPKGEMSLFSLPTYPRADVVPSDISNVLLTQPEDSEIFASFRNDAPLPH